MFLHYCDSLTIGSALAHSKTYYKIWRTTRWMLKWWEDLIPFVKNPVVPFVCFNMPRYTISWWLVHAQAWMGLLCCSLEDATLSSSVSLYSGLVYKLLLATVGVTWQMPACPSGSSIQSLHGNRLDVDPQSVECVHRLFWFLVLELWFKPSVSKLNLLDIISIRISFLAKCYRTVYPEVSMKKGTCR